MEYFEFRAMNTDILLAADGDPQQVTLGFERTASWIQSMETQLTRFSESSELAHLNRSNGAWFPASPELFEIVTLARRFYEETDHLFNPTIIGVLERIGYDTSFENIGAGHVPVSKRDTPPGESDMAGVQLDAVARAIRLPAGMRLDLGGIAKGWVSERAAGRLAMYAQACAVNAGGDMFMVGRPAGGGDWQIALEDPRDPARTLSVLRVGPGAVATSSITRRTWKQGDRVRHHLVDPRRGEPAETAWLSTTVVAPHAAVAEVFAKSLLIAGPGHASEIAARRPDIAFIAVDPEGKMWGSGKAKELIENGIQPER